MSSRRRVIFRCRAVEGACRLIVLSLWILFDFEWDVDHARLVRLGWISIAVYDPSGEPALDGTGDALRQLLACHRHEQQETGRVGEQPGCEQHRGGDEYQDPLDQLTTRKSACLEAGLETRHRGEPLLTGKNSAENAGEDHQRDRRNQADVLSDPDEQSELDQRDGNKEEDEVGEEEAPAPAPSRWTVQWSLLLTGLACAAPLKIALSSSTFSPSM